MKYWKRLNPDGSIRTVESYSHDSNILGAVEITQTEFESFISSMPEPQPINWKALWLAADTIAKKVAVLAKKAEVE